MYGVNFRIFVVRIRILKIKRTSICNWRPIYEKISWTNFTTKCQRNNLSYQYFKNIGSSPKIGNVKKLSQWAPHEISQSQNAGCQNVLKCVRWLFCETWLIHFLIEWWLLMKNFPFMRIIIGLLNFLLMTKRLNTIENRNSINRKLWWLSGGLLLALSITAFWKLTRVSLWEFTATNLMEYIFT